MSTDPKPVLTQAEKQIANAKSALAETEQIQRLEKLLEKEHAALIDAADPEDRAQMKQLGEINAQLQVIPRRKEKTLEKQEQAGLALCETAEQLSRTIQVLHVEEVENRLDYLEAILRPHFRDIQMQGGDIPNRARGIAARADIFEHMSLRITPKNPLPTNAFSECHNNPEPMLPRIIAHVHDLFIILSEYQANRRSFVSPEFKKAS